MTISVTKREFLVLSISVFFGIASFMGTDIHLASLPFIAEYMHASQAQVQQSVPLYVLGMASSLLFYGPISDRVGRKPVMIFALSFASVFCFVGALTQHITAFLAARILQGVGCGACIGMGRAMAVDVVQGDRLATLASYFSLFNNISPLLAPALGGYVQHYLGWQMNFVFFGIFLLLLLLLVIFVLPETNKHKNPHAIKLPVLLETYFSLLKYPVYVGCTLIAGLSIACGSTYNTISSYIFQKQYLLTPVSFGWITALTVIGSVLGKIFAPFSIKRLKGIRTMHLGLSLLALSGVLLLLFVETNIISVFLIVLGVIVMRFAQSIIMPITSSRALSAFHDRRGSASALYSSIQLLVAFSVASFVGGSPFEGVMMLGLTFFILSVAGLLLYFFLIRGSE